MNHLKGFLFSLSSHKATNNDFCLQNNFRVLETNSKKKFQRDKMALRKCIIFPIVRFERAKPNYTRSNYFSLSFFLGGGSSLYSSHI